MMNNNLIKKLDCDVINSNLEIMSQAEKQWFLAVISLILDVFPKIDIYTAKKYIGFGRKGLDADKVNDLL